MRFGRFFLLLAACLLLSPPAAVAADEAASLGALREQQAAIYAVVRDFHMQTLLSGDPLRTAQLKDALARGQARMGGAGIPATAVTAWKSFAKLAASNNIARDGYTDDNLVAELYAAADQLDKALTAAIAAVPAGKQRARADKAHAANLLLQRTAAAYLKRGAQMSPDVGAADDFDVGTATAQLDRQFQALAKELSANTTMRGVTTKWQFIRGSLVNYNEKSVPFIVDRYATQIDEGLRAVVAELDR